MSSSSVTALILGGAACLDRDLARVARVAGDFDLRVGINDALYTFRDLDALATLHPEKVLGLGPQNEWRKKRRAKGWPDVPVYSFRDHPNTTEVIKWNDGKWWTGGSSGLYAVGVALHALGADRVVLAGVPMDHTANRYRHEKTWRQFSRYRHKWQQAHDAGALVNVRSLRGWTGELLNPWQELAA